MGLRCHKMGDNFVRCVLGLRPRETQQKFFFFFPPTTEVLPTLNNDKALVSSSEMVQAFFPWMMWK